jgi:zinc transport system substrate-binding protein
MGNDCVCVRPLILLFFALFAVMPLLSTAAGRLTVYTVNYPLQYFAERIGGDRVHVHFPAPKDVDPAFWMPNVETITAYQKADLIILNGANYAKWVSKVSLPRLRMVDTSASFADRLITVNDTVTHSHGPGGEHSHSGAAFTTWLDFNQAIQQAEAILNALQRKRPEDSEWFSENFTKLEKDLRALDTEMIFLSEEATDRRFMASHPVYQYLARRYRLDLGAVTWEPNELPGPKQWQTFSQMLGQKPARWMLWEAKPMEKTAQKLSDMGISVVVFAPCMNVPDEGDFLATMQRNVATLRKSIENGFE